MSTYRVETTVESDGKLVLERLPFRKGEQVQVVIVTTPRRSPTSDPYVLRGSVEFYDRPTDPVAEEDWEALK